MSQAGKAFSAVKSAREVLAFADTGGLATLDAGRLPYASLVTVGTTPGGEPVILISGLALHTQNLLRDANASLILVAPGGEGGDPLAGARLSVSGEFAKTVDPVARRRFLVRHPAAAGYADFSDFAFWRVAPRRCHLVAGFGRIVDVPPADLFPDFTGCESVIEAEPEILAHMNDDHRATMSLYAETLLGKGPGAAWTARSVDPDGLDMTRGAERARLWFSERVQSPGGLRKALKGLADAARAALAE